MNLHAWRIKDAAPDAVHPDTILVEGGWLEVNLPADTYLALHAAGRVPHPFVDGNEEACRWVADREWWWRTAFEAPPTSADERLYLEFGGLDTFATIWLNGIQLGQTDNMFRAYRYDVTDLAHTKGGNEILIRFTPPSIMVAEQATAGVGHQRHLDQNLEAQPHAQGTIRLGLGLGPQSTDGRRVATGHDRGQAKD